MYSILQFSAAENPEISDLRDMFRCIQLFWVALCMATTAFAQVNVSGTLRPFHRVSLEINGPSLGESDPSNPFTDIRLNVTFSKGNRSFQVPGHFAADGNAGNSGANNGSIWRCYFAPDEAGTWNYTVSFREGILIAGSADPQAGTALAGDSLSGSISILPNDKTGPDLRAKGHLQFDGARYLSHRGTGEVFLLMGSSSPENLLASAAFDGTFSQSNPNLIDWSPHFNDWNLSDPTWANGKGKGLIGAVNYLAEEGMNGISVLGMNAFGEGQNVWPWTAPSNVKRFDVSKLDQWEILFAHANVQGIAIRFVLQENNNESLLDNGALGIERKVYYREMISRFGHLPGWMWDLGEANGQGEERQSEDAAWLFAQDPYRHPIFLNNAPNNEISTYSSILGESPELTGASLHSESEDAHASTLRWVEQSMALGKSWVVLQVGQGPLSDGALPASNYPGATESDNFEELRREVIYGNLMAGGGGVSFLFGLDHVQNHQDCNDFRSRAGLWEQALYAQNFFLQYLDLRSVTPQDSLVLAGDAWCIGNAGTAFAVYALEGSSVSLQVPDSNRYFIDWYDPRSGGALQKGSVLTVQGPGPVGLGIPPSQTDQDWMILLRQDTQLVTVPEAQVPIAQLNLFPNPADEYLELNWKNIRPKLLRIYSNTGQLIRQESISGHATFLSLSPLPSGIYLLELRDQERFVRKRFVKR